jgi:hypothetical protein
VKRRTSWQDKRTSALHQAICSEVPDCASKWRTGIWIISILEDAIGKFDERQLNRVHFQDRQ